MAEEEEFPQLTARHNPSTPEGQIEGARHFAKGLEHHPRRRLIIWVVLGIMALPILVFIIDQLSSAG